MITTSLLVFNYDIYSTGMSIYMAFFVLLLMFEASMPPASDGVPILGKKTFLSDMIFHCLIHNIISFPIHTERY